MFLVLGCSAEGVIQNHVPDDAGLGGKGGWDGGGGDASAQGGSDAGGEDAGVSPVLVAITPTPASQPGAAPSPADALQAEAATFAAGARAAVVALPWDAVAKDQNPELVKKMAFYAQHGKRVALDLAVVDRLADHRPASIGGAAWESAEAIAAMQTAIDALFAASGDEVAFLTIGRDVDVYLAAHPRERSGFITFAKQACTYAKQHADAPKGLQVGVAFTTAALKGESTFAVLMDVEDVVALSFFPGMGQMDPNADLGVATAIGQMADVGASKPVLLLSAGVGTDPLGGGNEDAQKKLFATLFTGIAAHRKSFALVNVVELHDAPHDQCTAWAKAQGEAPDGAFAAYACSLGLWKIDGTPKPAWQAVLAGSAALAAP